MGPIGLSFTCSVNLFNDLYVIHGVDTAPFSIPGRFFEFDRLPLACILFDGVPLLRITSNGPLSLRICLGFDSFSGVPSQAPEVRTAIPSLLDEQADSYS